MPAARASIGVRKRTGTPSSRISPASAGCRPVTILTSVDLPAPFSPTRAWIVPGATSKATSRTASMPPKLLLMPTRLRRATVIAASVQHVRRDAGAPRGAADAGDRLVVERDALDRVALLELGLEQARRIQPVDIGPPAALPDLPAHVIDARLERLDRLEGSEVDRPERMPVMAGARAVHHVAELRAIAGARQQRGQDSHDDAEADALVAADRLDQPGKRRCRVGGRPAGGVEGPALRVRLALSGGCHDSPS